ncbi:MAG: metallophosphoesterase [Saprospiraceae bacterium]|nr:metallophosphoesterase [Saprospiraceae bacterium]
MKNSIYTVIFYSLVHLSLQGQTLTRGPYLQMGNQNAITIRWRTDVPTNSKVSFGTIAGNLSQNVIDNNTVTEHEVRLTNLTPDTKYYYSFGSTTVVLQGDADNHFITTPPLSTKRRIRVVGFGDSGNGSQNQRDVRDAFLSFRGSYSTDVMLLMGDNAYSYGTNQEYQDYFFNVYQSNLLKNTKLYSGVGNHDYGNSEANTELRTDPVHYYDCFTLPKNGECGGLPSGTEAYYSFDYGNIHFVMLDSYGTEGGKKLYDSTSTQALWLKADLAANSRQWTVVTMHHPPYTKGSHDSDAEGDLALIREKINPILERFGVDLAIFGHSHVFERSFLIKEHYGQESTFSTIDHQVTSSNAQYDGSPNSCPIRLTSQKTKHGTVYVVAGSSGQIGGAASGYPHNAMFYSDNQIGGVFYFEVEDNRLDAFFLKANGTVGDKFTMMKDAGVKKTLTVLANQPTTLTASYFGNYNWTGGTTTRAITITPPLGTHTLYVSDGLNCLADTFVVNAVSVIPVELIDFQIHTTNQKTVLVEWKTASEPQNAHFVLERSADGNHFELLTKQMGHPLSNKPLSYSFEDKLPLEGINYYRLSQTDSDGKTVVLGVRSVILNENNAHLYLYPNPSTDGLVKFEVANPQGRIRHLTITDVAGKVVFNENVENWALSTRFSTGIYFAKLTEGDKVVAVQKFVVQ